MKTSFYSTALVLIGSALAASRVAAVEISTRIPGAYAVSEGPGGFIANFYQFALMIGGILAFGAIVYGGIKYTLAAGNPSGQTEGKEWIKSAIYGLLLLLAVYLVLYTINPELVNLGLPTLKEVSGQPGSGP